MFLYFPGTNGIISPMPRYEYDNEGFEENFEKIGQPGHRQRSELKHQGTNRRDRLGKPLSLDLPSVHLLGKGLSPDVATSIRAYAKSEIPNRIRAHLTRQRTMGELTRAWRQVELSGNVTEEFRKIKGMVFNQIAYEWLKKNDMRGEVLVSPDFTQRIVRQITQGEFFAQSLALDGTSNHPAITKVIVASASPANPTQQEVVARAAEYTRSHHGQTVPVLLPSTDISHPFPPLETITFANNGIDYVVPQGTVYRGSNPDVHAREIPFTQDLIITISNATVRDIIAR